MPLILLALATAVPAAEARDVLAPLPPAAVQATATGDGTLVSWSAASGPVDPVLGYHVYRMTDALAWQEVGSTDAASLSFVDASPPSGAAAYAVAAENAHGVGPQSAPATASSTCSTVGLSGIPPQPVINWDCLRVGFPGSGCTILVFSDGPRVDVNWDCVGVPLHVKILDLKG